MTNKLGAPSTDGSPPSITIGNVLESLFLGQSAERSSAWAAAARRIETLKLDSSRWAQKVRLVTADSRSVEQGAVYFAIEGTARDGHAFLREAAQKGAALLIGSKSEPEEIHGVPYLQVPSSSRALGLAAAAFYGNPCRNLVMIGVTGTSGKTTTTYLLESIFRAAGKKVGLIGTIECRVENKIWESTHTTPGAVELQHLLRQMTDLGCEVVVMEVSSHALKQNRVAGIGFDCAVFTNLTPEHLDYHPDLEDYFGAKAALFREWADDARWMGKTPKAAIASGDSYGVRLLGENRLQHVAPFGPGAPLLHGAELSTSLDGIRGTVLDVSVRSSLVGSFNALNLLGAVGAGLLLGVDPEVISRGIQNLEGVAGRLERIDNTKGIKVFVDYAHKPDALRNVLETLQPKGSTQVGEVDSTAKLITVFGCGGDRDTQKRPLMGKIATELSDVVIITNDNPRTENPSAIIEQILKGVDGASRAGAPLVIEDRPTAIRHAIELAKPGDVVLIAGKGHEDYQILLDPQSPPELKKTIKIHLDDREIARGALST